MKVSLYGRVSTSDKDQNLETQLLPLKEFVKPTRDGRHTVYTPTRFRPPI